MVLLLVFLALAYFFWRNRTPAYKQRDVERKAEALFTRNTAQASHSLRRFTQRFSLFGVTQDQKRVTQVKEWINASWLTTQDAALSASNDDFRSVVAWLNTLNEQEFAAFIQRLDTLAAALGVSLDDALDIAALSELKTSTAEVIRLAALMVWKSENIKTLVAYQEWNKAPENYKDPKFVDHLYADLVKAGLIKPNIDALMETDKQRKAHVVSSIRLAAAEYGDEFIGMLKRSAAADTGAALESSASS